MPKEKDINCFVECAIIMLLRSSIQNLTIRKVGFEYLTENENQQCGKLIEKLSSLRVFLDNLG